MVLPFMYYHCQIHRWILGLVIFVQHNNAVSPSFCLDRAFKVFSMNDLLLLQSTAALKAPNLV